MTKPKHHYYIFSTDGGFCGIAWTDAGISRFQLPTNDADATERLLLRRTAGAKPFDPPSRIVDVIASVRKYFQGGQVEFSGLKISLEDQSELFREIYDAVRRIGWGQTTTYGHLAKGLANDFGEGWELARDVGQAMAKNPMPLIIPCHRVLAAGNKVGGFSAPGGIVSKARMLELEGTRIESPTPRQNKRRETKQSGQRTLAF